MNIRFSIVRKLGLGFGMLTLLIVTVITVTVTYVNDGVKTLEESAKVNNDITNIYDPSEKELKKLNNLIAQSRLLIIMWAWVESKPDKEFKLQLKKIINVDVPEVQKQLDILYKKWDNEEEKKNLDSINTNITRLFYEYQNVMDLHPNMESYKEEQSYFMGITFVGEGFEIDVLARQVVDDIAILEASISKKAFDARNNMNSSFTKTNNSFNFLLYLVIYLGGFVSIGAIIIGIVTTRSIVKPVRKLRRMLVSLGAGVFPKTKMKVANDEIGDMSVAMNQLVNGLKSTTDFANELGQSNFDYEYKPLSEDDTLGHALLKMRDALAENERTLEQKVKERTEEVVRQRDKIQKQSQRVEELYKDVTDSIRYAKRLQESILPPESKIEKLVEEYFVLYKPKDIVSGDFYWFEECGDKVFFAAVDCTGHGVPGAFMSLVGANGLNQAVVEHKHKTPAEIMNDLNSFAVNSLNQNIENNTVRDGMDMALCSLDKSKLELQFAGANNPLYIVRDKELIQYKSDNFAIGSYSRNEKEFKNQTIPLKKGDIIYLFSDGYADQFGGPKGKKFMYKQFRNLILNNAYKPLEEQKKILDDTIIKWMGENEQIDDIIIVGVRV